MTRVLAILGKAAAALALLAVAVVLLRKDSLKAVTDAWAMRKCAGQVQADLDNVFPYLDPRVSDCKGTPTDAVCQVALDGKDGRKAEPVSGWDCSVRHATQPITSLVGIGDPTAGPPKDLDRVIARQGERFRTFFEGYQYVSAKLKDRAPQLGQH
jgi:hypothetical protein